MTTEEQLSLCAKAANIKFKGWDTFYEDWSAYDPETDVNYQWNPLESDGDALQLAMYLCQKGLMRIQIKDDYIDAFEFYDEIWVPHTWEIDGDDKTKAFRMAVVHCASEIGKRMK